MAKRKAWSTTTDGNEETRIDHFSQYAAERRVRRDAEENSAGSVRILATSIWFDEHHGRGWQLLERVEHTRKEDEWDFRRYADPRIVGQDARGLHFANGATVYPAGHLVGVRIPGRRGRHYADAHRRTLLGAFRLTSASYNPIKMVEQPGARLREQFRAVCAVLIGGED